MSKRHIFLTAVALSLAVWMAAGAFSPVYGGTTGVISGTITDSATGEALPGVNVFVSGVNLTTVTDSNGYYVITNVPPGDYKVSAELVGYTESWMMNVSVIMDSTARVDFEMDQAIDESEEIVVKEVRPMIRRDVIPTMYVVDKTQEQMVRNQPQTMYQIPGIVATQPGIVLDAAGMPHIRGGRESQVGYLIDGIPITEPLTNGFGTNTVTVGLDKMEIFTGGYRPEYGNAISGVFNQVVKTGRNAPGTMLELVGGSESFRGLHPEIGGYTEGGLDYYVGAYLWQSQFKGLDYDEVNSSDVIGKFSYPVSSRDNLSLLLGSGSAKYQFPHLHTLTFGPDGLQEIPEERDHTHQSHMFMALTLNHTISPSSFFTVRPYYFRSRNKVDAVSDEIGYWWETESATTGLQFDYTNQISEKHLLKAGMTRMAADNNYWATVPYYKDMTGFEYEYTSNVDTTQLGFYLQDQMRLSPKWGLELGIRYDRMKYDRAVNEDTSESQWSPRAGLSYALDPKTNLRFSYGKMIQFVHTQATERNYTAPEWHDMYGLGNADLRPERSTQYDLGWERQVNDNVSVQVTPFYRKFVDLLQVRSINPMSSDAPPFVYDNLGEGTSKGLEFLVKRRFSDNWFGWVAYTYSKAEAFSSNDRETITGQMKYVDWDQRHTLVAVVNHQRDKWNYSLVGRYGSGLPYGENNSLRAPSNTIFDLSIAREISGGWLPNGEIRLSIANLFNTRTPLSYEEQYDPETWEPLGWAPGTKVAPRFLSLSIARRF